MSSRHFLAGYQLKLSGGEVEPRQVIQDLSAFAKANATAQALDKDKRIFQVIAVRPEGLKCEIITGTGHYGIDSRLINSESGEEEFHRRPNHAESIRLCFVLDMETAPLPLAVFYKRGTIGTRTSFEETFNRYLAASKSGYRIHLEHIGPAKAIASWMQSGQLARIKLTRFEAADTPIGQLAVLQARMQPLSGRKERRVPNPIVEKSLTIEVKWGHMRINDRIRQLFMQQTPNATGIAKIVGEERFDPTEVEVTLQTERRQRTFRVGSKFRVTEDITDKVDKFVSTPAKLERAVLDEANAYLSVLDKQM